MIIIFKKWFGAIVNAVDRWKKAFSLLFSGYKFFQKQLPPTELLLREQWI